MSDPAAEIRTRPLSEAIGERYLSYALSTIMSRSLPDVRDGLKPVQRRLLHAMRLLKLDPDQGFKKCARIVGEVMGKYHPHGDSAIYDAMVRLAQDFAQRYPLVDGQGNFGNIDGDNAAAMRYTEARLTDVALALLDGIDENTVDFRPSYDGIEEEPVVLPAAFPNLLANGVTGIAVGMATAIPPHNVAEICEATLHLIKHPNATIEALVKYLPGPDFPTGGVLVEAPDSILEAYSTGRGGFRLRARWHKESLKGGGYQVIVTEMPYQVQKAKLIERIADLITAKKLVLLADVRDESSDDVRLVLEPKTRNVDADILMESLFKATDLEVRASLNMNVLDAHGVPRVMTLREVLQAFLDHRHEVLLRRTQHRLDKIAHRLEVLSGYLIAYLNLDEVIRIIREEDDPKKEMMQRWSLSEIQVDAILNMRLRALRKLEEIEIQKEYDALAAEQADLQDLLADEPRRWKTIAGQIRDIAKKFGKRKARDGSVMGTRRTEIGTPPPVIEVPVEAVIEKEAVTVICSAQGWIRAMKGHLEEDSDIKFKEGDGPDHFLHAETTDKLLIFGSNGRFYTVAIDKLPKGRGHGEPLRLSIDLPNEHEVISLRLHRPGPDGTGTQKLLMASDDGRGFQIAEQDVIAQTRNGKQIMNVGDDAKAIACFPITGDRVAVVSDSRKLLIFPLDELPEMGRSRGVILQKLKAGQALLPAEKLVDIVTFSALEGLTYGSAAKVKKLTDLSEWLGKRGAVGKKTPTAWPKSGKIRD